MLSQTKELLAKVSEHLNNEYHKLQLGRANPSLLEEIRVDSYGSMMPVKNIANVGVMDSQTINIQPWDRSMIHSIAKAITESGIWLNPQTMADGIIIKFPPLTEERRKEIAKFAKTLAEDAKISIRNIRQDAQKDIKKTLDNKEISEDIEKQELTKLQKMVDDANAKIEELFKKKEQDILQK